MSIKNQIIIPLVLISVVSLGSAIWIVRDGLTSFDHTRQEMADALQIVGLANHAIREHQLASQIVIEALEKNTLRSRVETVSGFVFAVKQLENHLNDILKYTDRPEIVTRINGLLRELKLWNSDAGYVLGAKPTNRVPTRIKMLGHDRLMNRLLQDVVYLAENLGPRELDTASQKFSSRLNIAMWIQLLMISLVCMVGVYSSMQLIFMLEKLSHTMLELAGGKLEAPIKGETRKDEVGMMSRSLRIFSNAMKEVVETKAKMERMALSDSLTGLPNRRGLREYYRLAMAKNAHQYAGIMHLDLDHFKAVNDTLGHDAGDFVLQTAAERMRSVLRSEDIVARIGGDEFVIALPGLMDKDALIDTAQRLIAQIDRPIMYEGKPCHIGTSIGIVVACSQGAICDLRDILVNADMALFHAKAAGRGRWAFFDQSMIKDNAAQTALADLIKSGLKTDQFAAWFQPIINTKTDRICGIEVLSRWQHPEKGLLAPESYLDVAVGQNLIEALGVATMEKACQAFAQWRRDGFDPPRLHFNLARAELLAVDLIDKIRFLLDKHGIAPMMMAIEVAEDVATGRNAEIIQKNLSALGHMGVEIILDNFGSAEMSVVNVISINAKHIKLSQQLRDGTQDDNHGQENLIQGVIGFARNLKIGVIGTGIETSAQAQRYRAMGCSVLQGYFYAKPMDAAAMQDFLAHQNKHRSIEA